MSCPRCGQTECLCGNHSFELGKLAGAVGGFLHGVYDREYLRRAYFEAHEHIGGQWCNGNGCGICPPIYPPEVPR